MPNPTTRGRASGHPRPRRRPTPRAGFTLLELSVATVVGVIAMMLLTRMIGALDKQKRINRERALAAAATANLLERMRGEDFGEVFALYNQDPADDPGGAGSAPGARFAVDGLAPAEDSPDGLTGEITFADVAGAGTARLLREDVANDLLGTPRDLNGDSMIDGDDHAADYYLLPISIRIRWQGGIGPRELVTTTQLCDFTP
ncbi:MAG: type II secretion system protein [Planctomycetota bacterium]